MDIPAFKQLDRYVNADLDKTVEKKSKRAERAERRSTRNYEPNYFDISSSDDEEGPGHRVFGTPRPKKAALVASGATTTPLVSHFFESVFGGQMAQRKSGQGDFHFYAYIFF